MKKLIIFSIFFLFFSVSVDAQTMYVQGLQKRTFRTGPGYEHKILKLVKHADRVKFIEKDGQWSKCRLRDGQEGWLLTKYIKSDIPINTLYQSINKKYKRLIKQYKALKKSSTQAQAQDNKLALDLSNYKKQIRELSAEYEILKKKSEGYLKLEASHKKFTIEHAKLKKEVETISDQLTQKNVWWFFGGAGVFLLGTLMGTINFKRKKKNSYLS